MNARFALFSLCGFLLVACGGSGAPPSPVPLNNTQAFSRSISQAAARPAAFPAFKIYVANAGDDTVRTYFPDGTESGPTISTNPFSPNAIAVDQDGKVYVTGWKLPFGLGDAVVYTFRRDGTRTNPTITIPETGYALPVGIAVGPDGLIYVLSADHNGSPGVVTTYNSDGTPAKRTFTTGVDSDGMTRSSDGKFYVTNNDGPPGPVSVTTYRADGTPAEPTITNGIRQPSAVAIGPNGSIFVADNNNQGPDGEQNGFVTVYAPGGGAPLMRVNTHGLGAVGIAVNANGTFYVANGNGTITTYLPNGKRVPPTIGAGLDAPTAIVLAPDTN